MQKKKVLEELGLTADLKSAEISRVVEEEEPGLKTDLKTDKVMEMISPTTHSSETDDDEDNTSSEPADVPLFFTISRARRS